jgi:hypothetical protein
MSLGRRHSLDFAALGRRYFFDSSAFSCRYSVKHPLPIRERDENQRRILPQ